MLCKNFLHLVSTGGSHQKGSPRELLEQGYPKGSAVTVLLLLSPSQGSAVTVLLLPHQNSPSQGCTKPRL